MTKEELQQIRFLGNEIRLLTSELENYTKKFKYVRDTVVGSRQCIPYDLRVVSVIGYVENESEYDAKKKRLRRKIRKLKKELQRLEEFIDSIDDSQMRQIMDCRYRKSMTWQQIAFEIGEHDESLPRRRHNAFLNLPNLPKISV